LTILVGGHRWRVSKFNNSWWLVIVYFWITMIGRCWRTWCTCKGKDKKVPFCYLSEPYRADNFFFRWRVWLTSVTVSSLLWCFWIRFINIFFNGVGGVIIRALLRLRGLFFSLLSLSWNLCQPILTISLQVDIPNLDILQSCYFQPQHIPNNVNLSKPFSTCL